MFQVLYNNTHIYVYYILYAQFVLIYEEENISLVYFPLGYSNLKRSIIMLCKYT